MCASPTPAAAFKSGVRWDAEVLRAQRVQAVQGVVSFVPAPSFSSQMVELLSLRVPAISKTAVSHVAVLQTGCFVQSLSAQTHR